MNFTHTKYNNAVTKAGNGNVPF